MSALGSSVGSEDTAVTVSDPVPETVKDSIPLCPGLRERFDNPFTAGGAGLVTVNVKDPVLSCPEASETFTVTTAIAVGALCPAAGCRASVQPPEAVHEASPVIPASGSSAGLDEVAVTVSGFFPETVKDSDPLCPSRRLRSDSPLTVGPNAIVRVNVPVSLCPYVSETFTVTVAVPLCPAADCKVSVQLPAAVHEGSPVILESGSSVGLEEVAVTVSAPVPEMVNDSGPA